MNSLKEKISQYEQTKQLLENEMNVTKERLRANDKSRAELQ